MTRKLQAGQGDFDQLSTQVSLLAWLSHGPAYGPLTALPSVLSAHFTDEDTKAQGGYVLCPGPRRGGGEAGLHSGYSESEALPRPLSMEGNLEKMSAREKEEDVLGRNGPGTPAPTPDWTQTLASKLASPGGTQRGGSQAEQRLAFTNQKGSPLPPQMLRGQSEERRRAPAFSGDMCQTCLCKGGWRLQQGPPAPGQPGAREGHSPRRCRAHLH